MTNSLVHYDNVNIKIGSKIYEINFKHFSHKNQKFALILSDFSLFSIRYLHCKII